MAGNVDTAKQAYEAFSNGDVQAATENWADDIVWDGGGQDLPGGGEHQGKDAALDVLGKAVGAWDEFVLHIDELLEAICRFYADRLFGPERRAILEAELGGVDDTAALEREAERSRQQKLLATIFERVLAHLDELPSADPARA